MAAFPPSFIVKNMESKAETFPFYKDILNHVCGRFYHLFQDHPNDTGDWGRKNFWLNKYSSECKTALFEELKERVTTQFGPYLQNLFHEKVHEAAGSPENVGFDFGKRECFADSNRLFEAFYLLERDLPISQLERLNKRAEIKPFYANLRNAVLGRFYHLFDDHPSDSMDWSAQNLPHYPEKCEETLFEELKARFDNFSDQEQSHFYGMIYKAAGSPTDAGPDFGQKECFTNRRRFLKAFDLFETERDQALRAATDRQLAEPHYVQDTVEEPVEKLKGLILSGCRDRDELLRALYAVNFIHPHFSSKVLEAYYHAFNEHPEPDEGRWSELHLADDLEMLQDAVIAVCSQPIPPRDDRIKEMISFGYYSPQTDYYLERGDNSKEGCRLPREAALRLPPQIQTDLLDQGVLEVEVEVHEQNTLPAWIDKNQGRVNLFTHGRLFHDDQQEEVKIFPLMGFYCSRGVHPLDLPEQLPMNRLGPVEVYKHPSDHGITAYSPNTGIARVDISDLPLVSAFSVVVHEKKALVTYHILHDVNFPDDIRKDTSHIVRQDLARLRS